jgi:hypothetical protein
VKHLVVFLFACGSTPKPAATDLPPLPGDPPRVEPEVAAGSTSGCIPSGLYNVTVDLADAKITQGNTGMAEGDTVWCRSVLAQVPAHMMSTMRLVVDNGAVGLEWPIGRAGSGNITGDCELEITSQPMAAKVKFANGVGIGATTYAVGTQHAGDTCTATDAKLTLEPAH